MTRTLPAVRFAPPGRVHHLLADQLPTGWAVTPFGPDGGRGQARDGSVVIVTRTDLPEQPGVDWTHASMSRPTGVPSYDDLVWLHRIVYGDGHAAQLFVPAAEHVNINARVLHLWGRADGTRLLPDFARYGTI